MPRTALRQRSVLHVARRTSHVARCRCAGARAWHECSCVPCTTPAHRRARRAEKDQCVRPPRPLSFVGSTTTTQSNAQRTIRTRYAQWQHTANAQHAACGSGAPIHRSQRPHGRMAASPPRLVYSGSGARLAGVASQLASRTALRRGLHRTASASAGLSRRTGVTAHRSCAIVRRECGTLRCTIL